MKYILAKNHREFKKFVNIYGLKDAVYVNDPDALRGVNTNVLVLSYANLHDNYDTLLQAAKQCGLVIYMEDFDNWWNDELLTENPFEEGTPVWWAWEGWHAGWKAGYNRGWEYCQSWQKATTSGRS
jgi:hypothetical protein